MRTSYDSVVYEPGLTGPQSTLINSQLVRTFPAFSYMPGPGPLADSSKGAGPTTLPGYDVGGAATNSMPDASSGGPASAAMAGQATSAGSKILGLPSLVFYILVAFLVGYVFIWQVHFK